MDTDSKYMSKFKNNSTLNGHGCGAIIYEYGYKQIIIR